MAAQPGQLILDVNHQCRRAIHVKRLVWYEVHQDIIQAITREKQIKKWNRDWKVNLIQKSNPDWRDLYDEISI